MKVSLCVTLGWERLENGLLLDAAERAGFEVLVTCDQSIPYQQNFTDRKLAVIVLSTNDWPTLRPVAAKIASVVDFVRRGRVSRIDITEL